jgi:two-component system sensor histidine kinase ResE
VEKFMPQSRQAQVDLQLVVSIDLPVLVGDHDRLAQVFTNLVENAIKYTPPGGQVLVSAQCAGDWFEVGVADTGPGIPEDQLPRIFERFYQTDKSRSRGSRSGVGLGLAIVREIVQLHGGEISAHNRNISASPGANAPGGSMFLVRLPAPRPDDSTLIRRR